MQIRLKMLLYFIFVTTFAYAQMSKIDPQIAAIALSPEKRLSAEHQGLLKATESGHYLRAILTIRGEILNLIDAGVKVCWRRGELVIADIPMERIETISALPEVVYIEADNYAKLHNDIGVKEIGGLQARQSFNLTGRGVLIGIIDSGIDFTHHDFRKADGSTRIIAILDLNTPGNYYGGKVYEQDEINATLTGNPIVTEQDIRGHGTHVAGIAAGDGSSNSEYGPYAGVAPEADLIIVKALRGSGMFELSESDQLIALGFIDSVATALGRPYVANLSFGGDIGAHDGTSAVERYIDELSGKGKIFVTSSGNKGDEKIHAREMITGNSKEITFRVEAYTPQPGSGNDQILLDGWYNGTGNLSVTLISPKNNSLGPVTDGNYREWSTTEGYVIILNGFYQNGPYYYPGVNPFNKDKEILILINDDGNASAPAAGVWTIRLSGRANPIHFWLADATMKAGFEKGATSDMTVTMPGTSRKVITVGAYTTRKNWKDIDGNNLTIDTQGTIRIGDIAAFSGAGPTRDQRTKPEITAPGQIIASSYSIHAPASSDLSIFHSPSSSYPNAFIMPNGLHALTSGTSMATPYVTGTCALLLQKYPDADAEKIKRLLTYTAKKPSFSGNEEKWGFGKLDAYQALLIDIYTLPDSIDIVQRDYYIVQKAIPNPCSNGMEIRYTIPTDVASGHLATLNVYTILGQKVYSTSQLSNVLLEYKFFWDCRDQKGKWVANGVYILEFRAGSYRNIQKVTVIH